MSAKEKAINIGLEYWEAAAYEHYSARTEAEWGYMALYCAAAAVVIGLVQAAVYFGVVFSPIAIPAEGTIVYEALRTASDAYTGLMYVPLAFAMMYMGKVLAYVYNEQYVEVSQ